MDHTPTPPPKPQGFPGTPPSRDRPTHSRTKSQPYTTQGPSKTNTTIKTPSPIHQRRQSSYSHPQSRPPFDASPSPSTTTTPLTPFRGHDDQFQIQHHFDPATDSPLHFSPSKARAAAQQSQQLSAVTRWLTTLLEPSSLSGTTATTLLTKWENEHRNLSNSNPDLASDTLRWLQEVMYVNRAADERMRLAFEAKKAELEHLINNSPKPGRDDEASSKPSATHHHLLDEIYTSLPAQAQHTLTALAATAIQLGAIPQVDSSTTTTLTQDLGQAVIGYTLQMQDLQRHIESLQNLQQSLDKQLEQARSKRKASEDEKAIAAKEAESMHPQTAQWMRETKQIALKISEYKDRVAALERSRPGADSAWNQGDRVIVVEEVVEMQRQVKMRAAVVHKLEETIAKLNGLPPDLDASRDEVKRARAELGRLKARREELFATIAQSQ